MIKEMNKIQNQNKDIQKQFNIILEKNKIMQLENKLMINELERMINENEIIDMNLRYNNQINIRDITQKKNNRNNLKELFKKVELTNKIIEKLEEKKCIICLENYSVGNKIYYLPCFHFFHVDCIKNWINNSKRCPLCNYNLKLNL